MLTSVFANAASTPDPATDPSEPLREPDPPRTEPEPLKQPDPPRTEPEPLKQPDPEPLPDAEPADPVYTPNSL